MAIYSLYSNLLLVKYISALDKIRNIIFNTTSILVSTNKKILWNY